jgi:hypothetical protein
MVLSVLPAQRSAADLKITQQLETFGTTRGTNSTVQLVEVYLQGPRIRVDMGQSMSSIVLNDRKQTFSLMHETRQYVVLPHEPAPETTSKENAPARAQPPIKYRPLEETKVLMGKLCKGYVIFEEDGGKTHVWVPEEGLGLEALTRELQQFMSMGFSSGQEDAMKDLPFLKNIPLRVSDFVGDRLVRQATVTNIETTPLPESIFEVPSGYSEMKMPGIE